MCSGWFGTGILLARIRCFTHRSNSSLFHWMAELQQHPHAGCITAIQWLQVETIIPWDGSMFAEYWWSSSHLTLRAWSTLQIYFLSAEMQSIGSYSNDPSGCHGCSSWRRHSRFCIGWIGPSKRFFPASLITKKDICWGVDENMQPNRGEGSSTAWKDFPQKIVLCLHFLFPFLCWMKWSVSKLRSVHAVKTWIGIFSSRLKSIFHIRWGVT